MNDNSRLSDDFGGGVEIKELEQRLETFEFLGIEWFDFSEDNDTGFSCHN